MSCFFRIGFRQSRFSHIIMKEVLESIEFFCITPSSIELRACNFPHKSKGCFNIEIPKVFLANCTLNKRGLKFKVTCTFSPSDQERDEPTCSRGTQVVIAYTQPNVTPLLRYAPRLTRTIRSVRQKLSKCIEVLCSYFHSFFGILSLLRTRNPPDLAKKNLSKRDLMADHCFSDLTSRSARQV